MYEVVSNPIPRNNMWADKTLGEIHHRALPSQAEG